MNVTELARRLKMTTAELFDALPKLGFDIGRRAIKVNDTVAQKIIGNWPAYRRQLEQLRAQKDADTAADELAPVEAKTVQVPPTIVVREFAARAGLNVSAVLRELMKNGIVVSMNEKIDFDTAAIIGEDLHLQVVADEGESGEAVSEANTVKKIVASERAEDLTPRPPVVVIMGHVDHGKTKLLDAIRQTNVVAGEQGGITQHIGAYQIERQGKTVTFIDTPGHEVFTAMRSRGAKVADVAVLVVAADDGVKPQTVEAHRIIEQAKVPFVVAINKIDKPEADVEKTKSELASKLKITPEEWGGKTICAPVSALAGDGIPELVDSILLVVEMEKQHIVANLAAPAVGTVIESHVDKGEGPVATILVQNGTLRAGEVLWLDEQPLGKVRLMKNYSGAVLDAATPATPVRIAGLKVAPNIGDIVTARLDAGHVRLNKVRRAVRGAGDVTHTHADDDENVKKINVIIKSDVLGSAEAIEESLEKLNTSDVRVQVVKKGLGAVTEGDIERALAAGALVIGFNVNAPQPVQLLARDQGVSLKTYRIIYELVDDVKAAMEKALGAETVRTPVGSLRVLAVFKTEAKEQVVGGKVTEGMMAPQVRMDVVRDGTVITSGEVANVQAGKQDVTRVEQGQECGLRITGAAPVAVGDMLEAYREEQRMKKL